MGWETFEFWDLMRLILKILRYIVNAAFMYNCNFRYLTSPSAWWLTMQNYFAMQNQWCSIPQIYWLQWGGLICRRSSEWIPITKIRRSWDRLMFMMDSSYLERLFYIDPVSWSSNMSADAPGLNHATSSALLPIRDYFTKWPTGHHWTLQWHHLSVRASEQANPRLFTTARSTQQPGPIWY